MSVICDALVEDVVGISVALVLIVMGPEEEVALVATVTEEVVRKSVAVEEVEEVLINFPRRLTVELVMLKYTVSARLPVSSRWKRMKLN